MYSIILEVDLEGRGTTYTFTYTFTEIQGTTVTFRAEAKIVGESNEDTSPDDNVARASTRVT
ncbi:MAG: hypothetical protein GTN80_00850 [Nitrososphaeria archaeon]|nr:hypothetical protein [Nitrososphaeria archaeon]NIQ32194.1 hypothetical protein [Nitrososphaeria archaeon]